MGKLVVLLFVGSAVFSVWVGLQMEGRDPLAWVFLFLAPIVCLGLLCWYWRAKKAGGRRRVVKRCCRLVVIVAGLGLMWIADHSLAANQDERPHQAEKKKVSSGILVARRECDRLEAQATKIQ